MRKTSIWVRILFVGSFIVMITCFGLLIELATHNPYNWLDSSIETLQSRTLWNERKELYYQCSLISVVFTFLSFIVFLIDWFRKSRHKLK
jgi:preprotein translocase subunit SecE